jgi:hypothetical protein|tara:strand:+ start:506 stop:904 length:399 start_codon:yes stop_codon:yes gene_type:complete
MLLLLFFLLMVKHFICDFALQGRFTGPNDKYLITSRRLRLHAFDHSVGTAMVFLFASSFTFAQGHAVWTSIVLFAVLDHIGHTVIDWLKNNFVKANNMQHSERQFWILTSFDQILHVSTYFAFVLLFDKLYF